MIDSGFGGINKGEGSASAKADNLGYRLAQGEQIAKKNINHDE